MKNNIALCCCLVIFSVTVSAQQQLEDAQAAIIQPIQQLFEGMLQKDTVLMQAVFHPEARLATTFTDQAGESHFRQERISNFITNVGSIPAETKLEEKILSYEIKTDDNLAIVWTPYEFYLNEQFSHCGVNAFELFRSASGWVITSIVDTRRKKGCQE